MKNTYIIIVTLLMFNLVSAKDEVRNWYFDFLASSRTENTVMLNNGSKEEIRNTQRQVHYDNDGDVFVDRRSEQAKGGRPQGDFTQAWVLENNVFVGRTVNQSGETDPMFVELKITGETTCSFQYLVGRKRKLAGRGQCEPVDGKLINERVLLSPSSEVVGSIKIVRET